MTTVVRLNAAGTPLSYGCLHYAGRYHRDSMVRRQGSERTCRTPWAPSATKRPPNSSPLCDSDESFYAKIHGVTHRNDDGTSRQAALRKCWPGERLLFI